ncbi:3'(2'),5'-bisphosphate nucleotidase CysQ [Cycloclasticus sp.]|uniref:3'(2'),5'-bisphosphate nucleotidase CysQ family protein n=1 Tax=Cycloclasticus sp. TaxID=2024830 RepID=UPI00257EB795|nr:inositol monophosphatase family protein [Cycloclasticus sp.]
MNIALTHKDIPVLGVVYASALHTTYWVKKGYGAFKDGQKLPLKTGKERKTCKIVSSRSHMPDETKVFIDEIKTNKAKELVSIACLLKICLVAEGEADIYPRLGPTMELDTGAAAHGIVKEVGVQLQKYENCNFSKHLYNKENLLNQYFIVKEKMD